MSISQLDLSSFSLKDFVSLLTLTSCSFNWILSGSLSLSLSQWDLISLLDFTWLLSLTLSYLALVSFYLTTGSHLSQGSPLSLFFSLSQQDQISCSYLSLSLSLSFESCLLFSLAWLLSMSLWISSLSLSTGSSLSLSFKLFLSLFLSTSFKPIVSCKFSNVKKKEKIWKNLKNFSNFISSIFQSKFHDTKWCKFHDTKSYSDSWQDAIYFIKTGWVLPQILEN